MLSFEKRKSESICTDDTVRAMAKATCLHKSVAQLLCERGIDKPEAAAEFLHPGRAQMHDPFLLPDMQACVDRIKQALVCKEKITVFCDYDADGTSGGAALLLFLKSVGACVDIMTPNRHKEGYGLNKDAVDQIALHNSTLIITVDCGITNVIETGYAKEKGIDVIITDHHECGETLPDTPYIVNPKRPDSEYPCGYLAGCGVAFKLIHALSTLDEAMRYIDLIAIGTITDIVPLLGENRAIAYLGLKKMRRKPSAGIAALANAAGIALKHISSYGISFGLGPRINAAGRMDTAHIAIDILSAQHRSHLLDQNAQKLCALNDNRRKEVDDILASAEEMIHQHNYINDSAILLADERWSPGVIGIAAAKIAEKYTRPCVLFGGSDGDLVGSARSIRGINMYEVLGAFAGRYEKFGGHAQAAGLTIRPVVLAGLRHDVCHYIDGHYDESVFVQKHVYDLMLEPADITNELIRDIEKLEPFGFCNEKPMIAVFGADITKTKYVGKNDKPHLKFTMRRGRSGTDAVSFFFKDTYSFVSRTCDFLCEASINDYNNRPQLVVRKIALHYDKRLIDSYLHANREIMTQHFFDEIVCLIEKGYIKHITPKNVFEKSIKKELAKSRFSLCIVAGTVPAFNRLLVQKEVDEALQNDWLMFHESKAFDSGNCIASQSVAGHSRELEIGFCGAAALADEMLRQSYVQHARDCFLDRKALLKIYREITRFAATRERSLQDVAEHLCIEFEKAAFAIRVFTELELIDVCKSGRILAIKNTGDRKELKQSACFRSFEAVLGME